MFKWVKSPKFQIDRSLPKTEDTSAKKVSLLHPAQFWTPSPPSFPVTALSAAGARAGGASRVRRPAGCPRGTTEAGDPEQGCRAGRGRSSASLRERRRLVWGRAARANCLARPSWSPSWSPRRTGPTVQCSELNVSSCPMSNLFELRKFAGYQALYINLFASILDVKAPGEHGNVPACA